MTEAGLPSVDVTDERRRGRGRTVTDHDRRRHEELESISELARGLPGEQRVAA
jgi:hypothetical protein